jgi:tetrahedral aminopeptidase
MTELLPLLKTLISAPGLSGHESPIRQLIEAEWRPLVDEISVSRIGSLHGLLRATNGQTPEGETRPSLLMAAHMDAIGLMVTGFTGGLLRLMRIGGLDPRVLPGQLVTVHGRQDLPGVIIQPPGHLLPEDERDGPVQREYLLVDTGLESEEVQRLVRVGDVISFAQPPMELGGELLAGHSLDNRASVAAVTHCLDILHSRQRRWDVWAVATVQEEETLGGAITSAFELRPTLAIAIDVTFASSPGSPSHSTFPLGKGVTLAWGPNIHPALFRALKETADRFEIPYHLEPTPRMSGTDAMGLQTAAEGIPTAVISIPLRYMHTPVEMVSLKDVTRAGRLLAEFASSLDAAFVEQLVWDE